VKSSKKIQIVIELTPDELRELLERSFDYVLLCQPTRVVLPGRVRAMSRRALLDLVVGNCGKR
jgi:hypothetical protein